MVVADQVDTMYAGNRRVLKFAVTDEDNGGAPMDLTGRIVKFALARFDAEGQPLKANPLVDKRSDTSGDIVITSAVGGLVEVTLVPADTASLADAGETAYYFELEVFQGTDGIVVASGTETIRRNVTNA